MLYWILTSLYFYGCLIRSAIKCNIWKYTREYPLHFTLKKNRQPYKHTLEWNDETRQTVEQLPTYNSCKTSLYHTKDLSRQQNIHLQPHTVFIDYEIPTLPQSTQPLPFSHGDHQWVFLPQHTMHLAQDPRRHYQTGSTSSCIAPSTTEIQFLHWFWDIIP